MKKLSLILCISCLTFVNVFAQYTKLLDFNDTVGSNPNGSLISDGTFLYGMTEYGGTDSVGTIFKIKSDGTGYSKLHDFTKDTIHGFYPTGTLFYDTAFLYGMAGGGINNAGIIFKIKTDGTGYSKLMDFNQNTNGTSPQGPLISVGTCLYGMTQNGNTNGYGNIFKINPDGTGYIDLFDFSGTNGLYPHGSIIYDGTFLYGMTQQGGASSSCGSSGCGVLFKIKPDGTGFTKLLDFADDAIHGFQGFRPQGSLYYDGTFLYGMTESGGANGNGTIFKIKTDGTGYTKLLDFNNTTNGHNPYGSLISDGVFLYGMTNSGGTNNLGTIFKIKSDGTSYDTLLTFSGTNGGSPFGSLIFDGSSFYGMTQQGGASSACTFGCGTVFKYQYSPCQINLISATNTDSQTVCINSAITDIKYVVPAASATLTGLPSGINYSQSNDTVTIYGTPSVSGNYTYSVSSQGTCASVAIATGTITVNNVYPVIAGNSVTICNGQTGTLITTGANNYMWSTGETTSSISKSPNSTTTYTVIGNTNGCKDTTTQTITITPNAAIALTSAAGTNAQTVCINTPLTAITYSVSGGGTGAFVTGLPIGVAGSYTGGVVTISGSPSVAGISNYTITTTGSCSQVSATGTITANNCSSLCQINLISAFKTDSQAICVGSTITDIKYTVPAPSATLTGLPSGVNYTQSNDTVTIYGTPNVSGSYTYSVSSAGTCSPVVMKTGIVIVDSLPTATAGANQTICANSTTTVSGAAATNGSILWTSNGAGSISSGANTLNPVYSSVAADAGNKITLTLTVTSSNACAPQTRRDSLIITVNSGNTTASISGNIVNYANGSLPRVIFTGSSGVRPYTFGYTVNGGAIQTISSSSSEDTVSIAVPVTTPTTYTYTLIQVADANGCGQVQPDSVIFTINAPLGINALTNESMKIKVFPNPFSNDLKVVVNEKTTVKITDVTGQLIYTAIVENGEHHIETSNYSSGLYFISFENEQGAVTKKMIKN